MVNMFWTNSALNPIINSNIIEYDIKSGNTSVMKYFHLRPDVLIENLNRLDKKGRVVEIGKMMREDRHFSKNLEDSFNKMIQIFLDENHLDKETDVISIKRDAVFVKDKIIKNTVFGDGIVKFIPKNTYVGFLGIKQYEFWIKEDPKSFDFSVDVKGMNDENIKKHRDGILSMISHIYSSCVMCGMDRYQINQFMSDLVRSYKAKELDFPYYREFNGESMFHVVIGNHLVSMDTMSESFIDRTDITYNYLHVIIPLIKLLC